MKTLTELQLEHKEWAKKNFPFTESYQTLLGLGEEVGELFHAHLKEEQNIRGESNAHQLEAKDAVGDIIIYLMHYCTLRDWAIEPILNNVWEQTVSKRDWKKNPQEG